MPTFQQAIDECRDQYLYTGYTPEWNLLQSSAGASDTSLQLQFPVGSMAAARGVMVAVDLELVQVWTASGTAATQVTRGAFSSVAAIHQSGTPVEVKPKFSQFRVSQAFNEELTALSATGLFRVGEVEVSFNPAIMGYDLGSITWDDIIDVRYEIAGPSQDWPVIRSYTPMRNADTSQFPSGNGIIVREAAYPGLPIRVRYRGPFTSLVNLTDDVAGVSGLPATATDIPGLGAAIRLTAGKEIQRNFLTGQRDPSMLESVPPGAINASSKSLMMLYQQRVTAEAGRLIRQYPRIGPR